jgi:hypothetical protein
MKKKRVFGMNGRVMRLWNAIGMALLLFGLTGCSPSASTQEGINVLFEDNPRLHKQEVYYSGKVIGQILDQLSGNGSVHKVTVRLNPDYAKEAGRHWVFYAENGRLHAAKIYASGQALDTGDKTCGFSSKASYNWFKLKTLLSDRVYKATQKAEALSRRFD